MSASREIFDAQIVLAGEFLPSIFSPDWFARNNLIGGEDLEVATAGNLVVSREVTNFQTDWFAFQALQQQIVFTSLGPVNPLIKDLAVGALMLLPETLVTGVGLNFRSHYKTSNRSEYHLIGDNLVPKDKWKGLFPDMHVGLVNLQVMAQKVNDNGDAASGDQFHVFVQPSGTIKEGIFVATNDHHAVVVDTPKQPLGEKAAQIVRDLWEPAWHRSMELSDQLLADLLVGD
ncbi:hypothetical protein [Paraburkholderia sp.]|uniref:hypothetical protein n=1 Tax=Paraburkholderia sp. TaxID=1926495 RepID=UPI0039E6FA8F